MFLYILIFIDQITKLIKVRSGLYSHNPGISFGLFADNKLVNILFIIIFFVVVLFFLYKNKGKLSVDFKSLSAGATTFFTAGVISNIIDRLIYWGVIDWISIPFTSLQNNLADWYIFIGAVWMVFDLWWSDYSKKVL